MRIHRDISEDISKMAPGPYQNQILGAITRDGIGEAAGPPWQATPKHTQGPCEGKSSQIQLPEQPHFFPAQPNPAQVQVGLVIAASKDARTNHQRTMRTEVIRSRCMQ